MSENYSENKIKRWDGQSGTDSLGQTRAAGTRLVLQIPVRPRLSQDRPDRLRRLSGWDVPDVPGPLNRFTDVQSCR
jgi:hypothetical protein